MITKTLTTTTGRLKINIPTDLSEITIGQLIAMSAETDTIPIIPELTKEITDNIIDYKELENIQEHILSLAHKIKYCYETELPKTITIAGKTVNVIKNLSIEPAGAYLASRDLIADEINRHIEQFGEDEWKNNFSPSLESCAGLLLIIFIVPLPATCFRNKRQKTSKGKY